MTPLTTLAARCLADKFALADALRAEITKLAEEGGDGDIEIPIVHLSSVSAEIADKRVQLAYPRIAVFSTKVKNTQKEKFRSLSGSVAVTAEIAGTAALLEPLERAMPYYGEAVTNILRRNIGDWGQGLFYSGEYQVDLKPSKIGGAGYLQVITITCELLVSLD